MLTTVHLDGPLGKEFGNYWELQVSSPGEALRLINANKPGIINWIRNKLGQFPTYKVIVTHQNDAEEELDEQGLQTKGELKSIRFVPLIAGAGSNTGRIVLGALLVVAAVVIDVYSFGSGTGMSGGSLYTIGFTMMASGAIGLLLTPPMPDSKDTDTNKSSYFDGPANTTAQGVPLPLIYGRCMVGSHVISASMFVDDSGSRVVYRGSSTPKYKSGIEDTVNLE